MLPLKLPHVLAKGTVMSCFCCFHIGLALCHLAQQEWHIMIPLSHIACCCWCCLLLLLKQVNIWLYLPHALMDFDQSWFIDATWKPSYSDEVKVHIWKAKVIWGQAVSWKCESILFEKLKSDWNQTWLLIQYGTFCMFVQSKFICQGQRS